MIWPRVPIQDVATVSSMGRGHGFGTSLLKVTSDQIEPHSGKLLSRERAPAHSEDGQFYFDRGDVLWARSKPDLGRVVVADEAGVGSSELVRLVVSPQRLDAAFLAHHLRSPEFISYAKAFASGTIRPRLSTGLLLRYAIPLPPLQEQRRVVKLLDRVELIAEHCRRSLEVIRKAGRALLVSIIGEPTTWTVSEQVQSLRHLVRPPSESTHIVKEDSDPDIAELNLIRPLDLLKDDGAITDELQEVPYDDRPGRVEIFAVAGAVVVATEFPNSWTTLPVAVLASKARLGAGIRALLPARADVPPAYLANVLRAASDRILVRAHSASRGMIRVDIESLLQTPIPIPSAQQLSRIMRYQESIRRITGRVIRLSSFIADAQSALSRRAFSGALSKQT